MFIGQSRAEKIDREDGVPSNGTNLILLFDPGSNRRRRESQELLYTPIIIDIVMADPLNRRNKVQRH